MQLLHPLDTAISHFNTEFSGWQVCLYFRKISGTVFWGIKFGGEWTTLHRSSLLISYLDRKHKLFCSEWCAGGYGPGGDGCQQWEGAGAIASCSQGSGRQSDDGLPASARRLHRHAHTQQQQRGRQGLLPVWHLGTGQTLLSFFTLGDTLS